MVIKGMKWRYHEMFAVSNTYVEIEFVDGSEGTKYLYMESGMEAYFVAVLKDSIIEKMYNYGSLPEAERLELDTYISKDNFEIYEFMNDEVPEELEKSKYIDIINFASHAIEDYPWGQDVDDEKSAEEYVENYLNKEKKN